MPGVKGASGRKATPLDVKTAMGNPGKRALPNLDDIPCIEDPPVKPDWLDDYASKKWDLVIADCYWITSADSDTLAIYCDAYSRYVRAQKQSQEITLMAEGREYKNPALTAMNEAFNQMRSAASELGLTPSARSGLNIGSKKLKDPAEKYFGTVQ